MKEMEVTTARIFEIVGIALGLIREGWIQKAPAKNADGVELDFYEGYPGATCYCLGAALEVGCLKVLAVYHAVDGKVPDWRKFGPDAPPGFLQAVFDPVARYVLKFTGEHSDYRRHVSVITWNDAPGRTVEEVEAILVRARDAAAAA